MLQTPTAVSYIQCGQSDRIPPTSFAFFRMHKVLLASGPSVLLFMCHHTQSLIYCTVVRPGMSGAPPDAYSIQLSSMLVSIHNNISHTSPHPLFYSIEYAPEGCVVPPVGSGPVDYADRLLSYRYAVVTSIRVEIGDNGTAKVCMSFLLEGPHPSECFQTLWIQGAPYFTGQQLRELPNTHRALMYIPSCRHQWEADLASFTALSFMLGHVKCFPVRTRMLSLIPSVSSVSIVLRYALFPSITLILLTQR